MTNVAEFRIDSLGALARQLEFTPLETRAAQVSAAEELLHAIEPNRAYPLEFVVYRITGYRPRRVSDDLLTGVALQHDLGLLIEHVSGTLDQQAADFTEPVLAIEDVCARFNVTSKTIQRWRRKGLPARRFVFADGKRRVGFLLCSVERFFASQREQAPAGMNLSAVGESECGQIIRRARRLVERGSCAEEIFRRIGKKLNRSPAAIGHILRKHDQEQPQDAILPRAAAPIGEEERLKIARGYRRGLSLRELSLQSERPVAAIYRVILQERLAKLSRRKVKFIDDSLYHQEDADGAIQQIVSAEDVMGQSRPEEMRVPRDLPPYLADLYRTPLLSPARERALFLKFNFHKFRFVTARKDLEPQFARARNLAELEAHLHEAIETKNAIVRANMRLVVSVARKHLRPGVTLTELMSEGALVLMRAVESFDTHRGNRFSTYATFALMKGFARSVPEMLSAARKSAGIDREFLDAIPDQRAASPTARLADREQVRQLLSHLDERERAVLRAHYGVGTSESPATFDQLSQKLGLSKQRVRQIERIALGKLRMQMSAERSR
jgi:RNA polymerase primary sigma factor